MAEINNSDSVALAIDLLKQNGFSVYPPGEVPHVLIEVEGGVVQNVISNAPIRCIVKDEDIQGMDDEDIIADSFCITESDMAPHVIGSIADWFIAEPAAIGGLDAENLALHDYLKSINF